MRLYFFPLAVTIGGSSRISPIPMGGSRVGDRRSGAPSPWESQVAIFTLEILVRTSDDLFINGTLVVTCK